MAMNRKFVSVLLALIILCACARAPQQLVFKEDAVLTNVSESKNIADATLHVVSNGRFTGNGFFVAPDKVATNIHIMVGVNPISTYVRGGNGIWSVRNVAAYDVKNDLIILKVFGKGAPLPLGDSDAIQSGETVSMVKYAGVKNHKVTEGTMHSVRNADKWLNLKLNAPPGCSGSAILNSKGQVIGVVAWGLLSYIYAPPSNALRTLLARSKSTEPLAQWQKRKQISAYHYLTQANQKYTAEHYEESIVDLDKAIQLNPEFAKAYYGRAATKLNLGGLAVKSGDVEKARVLYQAALEDYTQAIKLYPQYGDAYGGCGTVKIKVGKLESDQGNAKRAQGLYTAALEEYTQAIKLEPQDFRLYHHRGFTKFKLGESEYVRGNTKEAQDLYQKAIEDYTQAIQIDPEHAYVYNNRGWVKYLLGESEATAGNIVEVRELYEAAIDDYRQVIQLDPEYAYAYNNQGWVKYLLGKFEATTKNLVEARTLYEAALIDVDKSIQLDSDNAFAYHNRGVIKSVLGDPERAIIDFNKAIELNPEYAEVYYERGLAKEVLGQMEAAKVDFEKAKELDPDVGK